ncbi:hypothetical protein [Mesorhizobium sp. B2-4-11]|uniref:hypothetical protein n=1 Tax=Mesorhizobium sp. B2-4-11 TaxID=2589938 RepID=UPI001127B590|nr:hypothetical protein [Mesorhizobium sp. B2-4-11]TPL06681.1 hypothetical protein FJ944_22905 [Mesorhizobium sp. B2-4-11]
MANAFYDDMADMASELLGEFKQGFISLSRTVTADPDPSTPWIPGTTTTTVYPLDAVARRVSQKYVDGTLIVATDDQITFAVPEIVPAMTDILVIDGVEHAMKDLRPIPAAGTPVAYIAFVAG